MTTSITIHLDSESDSAIRTPDIAWDIVRVIHASMHSRERLAIMAAVLAINPDLWPDDTWKQESLTREVIETINGWWAENGRKPGGEE